MVLLCIDALGRVFLDVPPILARPTRERWSLARTTRPPCDRLGFKCEAAYLVVQRGQVLPPRGCFVRGRIREAAGPKERRVTPSEAGRLVLDPVRIALAVVPTSIGPSILTSGRRHFSDEASVRVVAAVVTLLFVRSPIPVTLRLIGVEFPVTWCFLTQVIGTSEAIILRVIVYFL